MLSVLRKLKDCETEWKSRRLSWQWNCVPNATCLARFVVKIPSCFSVNVKCAKDFVDFSWGIVMLKAVLCFRTSPVTNHHCVDLFCGCFGCHCLERPRKCVPNVLFCKKMEEETCRGTGQVSQMTIKTEMMVVESGLNFDMSVI